MPGGLKGGVVDIRPFSRSTRESSQDKKGAKKLKFPSYDILFPNWYIVATRNEENITASVNACSASAWYFMENSI
jgi:hypothetical protein